MAVPTLTLNRPAPLTKLRLAVTLGNVPDYDSARRVGRGQSENIWTPNVMVVILMGPL